MGLVLALPIHYGVSISISHSEFRRLITIQDSSIVIELFLGFPQSLQTKPGTGT